MKLASRNPTLLAHGTDDAGKPRSGMGLQLDCPCKRCIEGPKVARVGVWFSNPIDGGPPYKGAGKRWERKGEDLDKLTIAEPFGLAAIGHCDITIAHGEIRGGYESEPAADPERPVKPSGARAERVKPAFDPPPGAPA